MPHATATLAVLHLAAALAAAVEPLQLEPLLAETIVGTTLPLAEVQRYCEARVPVMPAYQSAEEWQHEASRLRQAILERVVYAGEAAAWRDLTTAVEWLDEIEGGPGYRIRRLRFEVVPGMWTAGLLYEPLELSGKVPAILNVNGHTSLGKQYPAKQIRCINQAKRGMLALNVEWLGMGQLSGDDFNHARMNQLDLCGTSGLALVTAAFESEAIDRVELFDSLGSLKETIENNWPVSRAPELFCFGLLEQFDLRHLIALVAPRPVVFHEPGDRAKAELAGAPAWYRLLGSEHDPLAAP